MHQEICVQTVDKGTSAVAFLRGRGKPKGKTRTTSNIYRRMVDRHVWQDALDEVVAFTQSSIGSRTYSWRIETIERSFAEVKVNHGLRYARMLGIKNMLEQCFLTAAVQNIKSLVTSFLFSRTSNPASFIECRVCR